MGNMFTIVQTPKPRICTLIPNAVGCHTDLTPVGAVNNWQCVDDPIETPDDDTTYVKSSSTLTLYDMYVLSNHTTETGTINYVRAYARAKSHQYAQSSDGIFKIGVTDNACTNLYWSEDIDLITTYNNYSKVWAKNPRTNVAWTWANIDNLQVGISCSSPTVKAAPYSITLADNGIDTDTWNLSTGSYWYTVYGTCASCDNGSAGYKELLCEFENTALGAEYTITKVRLITKLKTDVGRKTFPCTPVGGCYDCSNETPVAELIMITNGWDYYGSEFNLNYNLGNYTTHTLSYINNPQTGTTWTWAEVNAIVAGCGALDFADTDFCGANHVLSKDIKIIVDYLGDINPEIRTTQTYVDVNYTPVDSSCSLTRPSEISYDHSRNVKMLNFWNGDREVYDLSRSNKTMVLTGMEYGTEACDRILCVRTMGKDGSPVTISELGFAEFNGEFRIRQFGWQKTSNKPLHFNWILEVESAVL